MPMKTLKIAIVGHTNTGKTSLIRTITRDRNFGEVKDEASTTIDVAEIQRTSNQLTLTYVDTPGIEDAMDVLDTLEKTYPSQSRLDEASQLLKFANDPKIEAAFEQEVKVIKQLFATDLTCYMIDCRLPFLPKFDDELTLIEKTHHPILPILNFVNGEHLAIWKQHLKAHGIHHYLEFDTIMPPQKRRFYEQIAIMFPEYYPEIMAYIQLEELAEQKRLAEALNTVANFYLNIMTLQIKAKRHLPATEIMEKLHQNITIIEQKTIHTLLTIYQFNAEDIAYFTLMVQGEQYDQDFFTSDNLIDFTIQFSKGAGVGAGLMVGVDALAGFTTLGAASATGAVIGGLAASLKHYGTNMIDKLQDIETYCVNNEAINHLTTRMLLVIAALNGRSHAALKPIHLQENPKSSTMLQAFIQETKNLRAMPEYCELENPILSPKRNKQVQELASKITPIYQNMILNHETNDDNLEYLKK